MTRTVYLNGEFLPADQAKVSIFDRGLNLADGVYEVLGVLDGKLIDSEGHLARLWRSLGELSIPAPFGDQEVLDFARELVAQNGIEEGLVYMQITRGVAERDFVFPAGVTPTVFAFTQPKSDAFRAACQNGVTLKSAPDLRWARRDIKSTGLLAQVLAKQAAKEAGCDEALMVKDGTVTEGGATSFFMIKDGVLITRPLSNDILPGVTRKSVLALARDQDLAVEERTFTLEEAYAADEAFITGASTYVCPVLKIDGHVIGAGEPGPMVRRLQDIYLDFARASLV